MKYLRDRDGSESALSVVLLASPHTDSNQSVMITEGRKMDRPVLGIKVTSRQHVPHLERLDHQGQPVTRQCSDAYRHLPQLYPPGRWQTLFSKLTQLNQEGDATQSERSHPRCATIVLGLPCISKCFAYNVPFLPPTDGG
jgi:hypothetical protein